MAIDISASHSTPLAAPELSLLHAWWRAANYLSVGQIYLLEIRCCASRSNSRTSSHGCSAIGGPRPG